MKTILVTGSAGRLGQAAVVELLRQNHRVIGIDCRPTPGLPDAVVDTLQNPALLQELMKGVDAVIHLAATPDDPVWPLPPEAGDNFLSQLVPNNLVPTYHILEAARKAMVSKVILASSGQVVWDQSFDGPFPIKIEATPTPRWWYACTKLFLEAIGESYAKQKFFSVIAVRLGFCPRDAGQVAQIAGAPRDQDVYLSPGDAGRFFGCCVKADRPRGSFDVVYATSIPKHLVRFDMEPAKRLVGFEPKETWPDGVTIPNMVSSSASS
jgi:uronate dehydrogenase